MSRPRSPITVVPYDPLWPREFDRSSAEVATALGPNLLAIHHIGSTSIPGIHAKPIIDMLAVVADLAAVDQRSAAMERLGYEVMGEFGIDGRRYFRRDDPTGRRTHQIHAFADGSPHVRRHLAFRDFMRAHPALAEQYGQLKQSLAAAHPHDMEAYMDGKDGFIKEMQARALVWSRHAPTDTTGLTFIASHDHGSRVIRSFRIDEGREQAAATALIKLMDHGHEVSLRNDLDEGLEGTTDFRKAAAGYERFIGGHGWQSGWKPVNEADVLSEIVSLAPLTRQPHAGGSLVQTKV